MRPVVRSTGPVLSSRLCSCCWMAASRWRSSSRRASSGSGLAGPRAAVGSRPRSIAAASRPASISRRLPRARARSTSARAASKTRWRNSCSSLTPASRNNSRRRCFSRLMASSCFVRAARIRRARLRIASRRAAAASCRRAASASCRSCSIGTARASDTPASAANCTIRAASAVQFPLPAGEILPALPKPALPFGNPIAALHQPATCFGTERSSGKPTRREGLPPASPGGLQLLLGVVARRGRRFGLLPGRAAASVQWRQLLQGRQLLLGRLQPAGDRSAAARQLGVQGVAIVLGLLELAVGARQAVSGRRQAGGRSSVRACTFPAGGGAGCRPDPSTASASRPSR